MATGARVDPYRGFNFRVEIDGTFSRRDFRKCRGSMSSTPSVDYREGTDPTHVRKLPGLNTYSAISLKRGITDSDELWKWRKTVIDGKTERKNGSIVAARRGRRREAALEFLERVAVEVDRAGVQLDRHRRRGGDARADA